MSTSTGPRTASAVVYLGILVYLVSLALPFDYGGTGLQLVGWHLFWVAVSGSAGDPWFLLVWGPNAFLWAALFARATGRGGAAATLSFLALLLGLMAPLVAFWRWDHVSEVVGFYRSAVPYWAWVASFALVFAGVFAGPSGENVDSWMA